MKLVCSRGNSRVVVKKHGEGNVVQWRKKFPIEGNPMEGCCLLVKISFRYVRSFVCFTVCFIVFSLFLDCYDLCSEGHDSEQEDKSMFLTHSERA